MPAALATRRPSIWRQAPDEQPTERSQLATGAAAIGGCCRTEPDDVRALAEHRRGPHRPQG
ncbi:MAG: homocysteine S-methyltransferase family protein [Onishia taeanensis]|uniref:homocysteine S-methyltransferase family protein n=1 Tax=Onishia taeanensis TaxID=284577 RepID=UPI003C7A5842